jgi:hypothetical protein
LVREDRCQIPVAEPAGVSAPLQRVVDLFGAVQLGEIDRFRHLAPYSLRTRSASLDQPSLRSRTEREERALVF